MAGAFRCPVSFLLLMNLQKTPRVDNENDDAHDQGLRVVTGKGSNAGVMLTDKSRSCPRISPEEINEVQSMIARDPEILNLFNEMIEKESMKFLACALNRLLHEIRTSPNPKETTVIIGWAFGCNPAELSTWEEVLVWLKSMGVNRSRSWLFLERERITKLIKE